MDFSGPERGASVALALVIILSLVARVTSAASGPLLTSSVVATSAQQATENGVQGVAVNYSNSLIGPQSFCFYFVLVSSTGQTLEIAPSCVSGVESPTISQFYPLNGLAIGSYFGNLFVTTSTGVPVSAETSVAISIT